MRLLNSVCKVLADAFTDVSYEEATVGAEDNPKVLGLYELSDTGYVPTQDELVVEGKTYYRQEVYKVPVCIEQVPNDFIRPCFLVELVTDPNEIKNYHTYQINPTFQIVYFAERDIANQVYAENLYLIKGKLTELFLLALALPIEPQTGVKERKRYAKIESFNQSLRLDEGAIYSTLKVNFTENVPHIEDYDLMENVALRTMTKEVE